MCVTCPVCGHDAYKIPKSDSYWIRLYAMYRHETKHATYLHWINDTPQNARARA